MFDPSNLPDAPAFQTPKVESIAVTPTTPKLKRVLAPTQQLTAIATFSDSSTLDVTARAEWSSSDGSVAMIDAAGVVTAGSTPGDIMITATLGDVVGTAPLTVADPTIVVASYSSPRVDYFPAFANGDVAPIKSIAGPTISLSAGWATGTFRDEVYVADTNGNAINVYAADATGDAAPIRRIAGPATRLGRIFGLIVTETELYVAGDMSRILVFPRTADGNATPIRDINGALTQLSGSIIGLALANGELFATSETANAVSVFPANGDGNIAPTRRLTGAATLLSGPKGVFVKDTEMFVVGNGWLWVYPVSATGDIAPTRKIASSVSYPGTVQRLGDELFIPKYDGSVGNSVVVLSINAAETDPPVRTITGAMTKMSGPLGLAIY